MVFDFNLVGSGTWVIEVDKKFKIGCDPALAPSGTRYIYKGLPTKKLKQPVYQPETFKNTKVWLVSHGHFDHLDKYGLKVIPSGASVFSHKNCSKLLKKHQGIHPTYMKWDEKQIINVDGYKIEIQAIYASHGMNWFARFLMEGVNGYFLKITHNSETKTIYATSDTVFSDKIVSSLKYEQIDLMVANMGNIKPKMPGGPFTMNAEMLEQFAKKLKPAVVLPIHIDDFSHFLSKRNEYMDKYKVLENGENITI